MLNKITKAFELRAQYHGTVQYILGSISMQLSAIQSRQSRCSHALFGNQLMSLRVAGRFGASL